MIMERISSGSASNVTINTKLHERGSLIFGKRVQVCWELRCVFVDFEVVLLSCHNSLRSEDREYS